jgi:hydroxyacylglutathione hydrolase
MIKIYTIVITPFAQNCRVLVDDDSRTIVTIDPGGDLQKIFHVLKKFDLLNESFNYSSILLTHSHIDHAGGVVDYLAFLGNTLDQKPDLMFHKDNDLYRDSLETVAARYGLSPEEYKNVPDADRYLEDNDQVSLGSYRINCLFTPGHAPGHAEIEEILIHDMRVSSPRSYEGPLLIAGDTLFEGSIGRTDLPGGNHQQLLDSIKSKLMNLPDETLVLSGHGSNTVIGRERDSNPFLQ